MSDEREDALPLVPIDDLVALLRGRPGVIKRVVALVAIGLVLRMLIAWLVGSASENAVAGLLTAMGLVPFALIAVSFPLHRLGPDDDWRSAAVIWRWTEAVVAGTASHGIVLLWGLGATTLRMLLR